MSIARARASDDHFVQGVVILRRGFLPRVEIVVSQCVQFGEVDAQIGDLDQFLNTGRVGIPVAEHAGRENAKDDLKKVERERRE